MNRILIIFTAFSFLTTSNLFAVEYDRVTTKMNQLISTYPNLVQSMNIGKNDQNALILGLKIQKPDQFVDQIEKRKFILVGTHHGNERLSADLALRFAEDLLKRFSGNITYETPDISALEDAIFYVVPVLNIDGFNANRREEKSASGQSVDPNRDYPDVCIEQPSFRLKSTSNLAKFIEQEDIVGAVTVHGYIGTFTYPWGIYTDDTKTLDDSFFKDVTKKAVSFNNYRTGTHTDVIYAAAGAFEDWAYHKFGVWTTLLELARSPKLDKDSLAMLSYFADLPSERSNQHQHLGNCTQTWGEFPSRP